MSGPLRGDFLTHTVGTAMAMDRAYGGS